MQVPDIVWDAALDLAKAVKDHEDTIMDKYSEDWNRDILFRMNSFYFLLNKYGESHEQKE